MNLTIILGIIGMIIWPILLIREKKIFLKNVRKHFDFIEFFIISMQGLAIGIGVSYLIEVTLPNIENKTCDSKNIQIKSNNINNNSNNEDEDDNDILDDYIYYYKNINYEK